eukprot:TRINITY_DN108191_c0_g1_i1.p1 TRINITY_DN108191_c0_g1~~TRINITY_DN108191_c0_g1_i1.p1  ORF type:complete len:800 (-),score=114.50 TRINITY_DN108191_c0_g1_i1:52-2253(-)
MVAPCSASPTVFVDRPNVYSSVSPSTKYLSGPFESIKHVKRVSYFYEDVSFTKGVCAAVPGLARAANIQVLDAIMISDDADDTEVAELCQQLSNNPPDALIGCVYINVCHRLVEAMQKADLNIPAVLLTTCIGDPSFSNTESNGIYFTGVVPWLRQFSFFSEDSQWTASQFSTRFEQKFGQPPMYQVATAQAGIQMLVAAMIETGSTDPVLVTDYMKKMSRLTVLGNTSFDVNGQGTVSFKAVQVLEHNQPLALVAPVDVAEASMVYPMPTWIERKCTSQDSNELHEHGYDASGVCKLCGDGFISRWSNETQRRRCVETHSQTTADASQIVVIVMITLGSAAFAALGGYGIFRLRKYVLEKIQLEQLRDRITQEHISTALTTVTQLMHPMALVSASRFQSLHLQELRLCYESARNKGYILSLDDASSIAHFKHAGNRIIFFSYERLYWEIPGPNEDQHAAMLAAIQNVKRQTKCNDDQIWIWLDVLCIPQKHQHLRQLAVSSLYAFASHADIMVIIAPRSYHQDAKFESSPETCIERVWVRIEHVFHIAKHSRATLYLQTQSDFAPVPADWLQQVAPVFEADMTCCRLGHPEGFQCDREKLVVPMLGLYFDLLMQAKRGTINSGASEVKSIFDAEKSRMFPKMFQYSRNGSSVPRELFGDMVERMEKHVRDNFDQSQILLESSSRSVDPMYATLQEIRIPVPTRAPVHEVLSWNTPGDEKDRQRVAQVPLGPN